MEESRYSEGHLTYFSDDRSLSFTMINPKLISVNEQYMHPVRKCKDNRYRSYVAKTPYLKEVQSYFAEEFQHLIPETEVKKFKDALGDFRQYGLSLRLVIRIPEDEFYEHDASNYIKAIEDCIASRIGIDDKRNVSVSIDKYMVINSKDWELTIDLEVKKIRKEVRLTPGCQTVLSVEGSASEERSSNDEV